MAEVFVRFTDPVLDADGRAYHAQVCGAAAPDGRWEGWIEFIPVGAGVPLRTERETTQPNRQDTLYWATGLTPVYLDGALNRALNPSLARGPVETEAQFEGPAPRVSSSVPAALTVQHAALDPFSVYAKGETLLRKELGALSRWHLVNIITAYDLSLEPMETLNALSPSTLIDIIVAGVREPRAR